MEKKSKRKRISVPGKGPVATSNVKKISSGMIVANEIKPEDNQPLSESSLEDGLMQNVSESISEVDNQVAVNMELPVQAEIDEKKGRKPRRTKKKNV